MKGEGAEGSSDVTSEAGLGKPADGFLRFLREVSLGAVVAGAMVSVGLMLRAGRSTPSLLLVLFVIWILSPFVTLRWAIIFSKRWSALTRATLYCVTIIITLGSPAIYEALLLRLRDRRALSCLLSFPQYHGSL